MQKYITCNIHPFIYEQTISIYEDGKCIKELNSRLTNLQDEIYALCKQYNISNVILSGSKIFSSKIKKDFTTTKYNEHLIKVYLEGDDTSALFN